MVYNSGNFKKSVTYLWQDGKVYDGFLVLVSGYMLKQSQLGRFHWIDWNILFLDTVWKFFVLIKRR